MVVGNDCGKRPPCKGYVQKGNDRTDRITRLAAVGGLPHFSEIFHLVEGTFCMVLTLDCVNTR